MKTNLIVYDDVEITNAPSEDSRITHVDLQAYNTDKFTFYTKITNGPIPPKHGRVIQMQYAFSPFDLSSTLNQVPGITSTNAQTFDLVLRGESSAVSLYQAKPIEILARYLYVWYTNEELNTKDGASLRITTTAVVSLNNESSPMRGTRKESSGLVNSCVWKAGSGTLYNLYGYNNKSTLQYIQLFDAIGIPDEGSTPIGLLAVDSKDNFGLDIPVTGLPFSNGLVICNSLTPAAKQIGEADCFFYGTII